MRVDNVFLSKGSQRNSLPEYCIDDLKLLIQMFHIYQWCPRLNPLDVPENIFLSGGRKPSYSPQQSQEKILQVPCCRIVLCQFLMEERSSTKKW